MMASSTAGRNVKSRTRLAWYEPVCAGLLYACATVVLAWPLSRAPATTVLDAGSLYGPAGAALVQRDINLTMWTLAWVSRAVVTDPVHLFDANVFYPARSTLACSEHMLGNAPFFAPVYLVTGNPVLAHQLTLAASFVVAGLAMAAYVYYWTRDRLAAVAAGFFFAFAPYRVWQLGTLHVVSIGYLPLVLLGVDATLDGRDGWRAVAGLSAALLLSSLCSFYVGYATFTLAGVYLVTGTVWRGRRALRRVAPALGAIAVAVVGVAVVSAPYVMFQRSGVIRDYTQPGATSLALLSMVKLGPTGLLACFIARRCESIPQFLTYGALVLGIFGVCATSRWPRWPLVILAAVAVVLSLGPTLPIGPQAVPLPWRWLAATVPGFSAMRIPQRFGAVVTTAVMGLAGLGLAAVRGGLERRGRRALAGWLAVLAVGVVVAEATPGGLRALPMPVGDGVPALYRWLGVHGDDGPLLELPVHPGARRFLHRQSLVMYYSTFHWLPMVNGYSSYPPPVFTEVMTVAEDLPAPAALDGILERIALRWVVLHRDELSDAEWPAWERTLSRKLSRVAEFGDAVLYEVPGAAVGPDARCLPAASVGSDCRCRTRRLYSRECACASVKPG